MKKKLLVTMLTLAMAGSLMACGSKEGAAPASEAKTEAQTEAKAEDAKAEDTKAETEAAKDEAASGEKHLVGVAMPTKDLQRWNQDGSNMKATEALWASLWDRPRKQAYLLFPMTGF